MQIVEPAAPVPLPLLDYSNEADGEAWAASLLEREGERTFDLGQSPLIVLALVKTAENCHWLIQSHHHIISDAPSSNVFVRDLADIYETTLKGEPPPPPLAIQYADYAVWQRKLWQPDNARYREVIDWWRDRFSRTTTGGVLHRRTKPAGKLTVDDWRLPWGLDRETSQGLDQIGYGEGATYFMVRLAVVAPVVAILAGTDTVVIDGVSTNRTRVALEPMYGLFANAISLIIRCEWDLTFRQFVGCARRVVIESQERGQVPYHQLRREMKAKNIAAPIPHLLLNMATPRPPSRSAGLLLTRVSTARHMPPGIVLGFDQYREENECYLSFDARIHDTAGMREFRDEIIRFAAAAARSPDASLRSLANSGGLHGTSRQVATGVAEH